MPESSASAAGLLQAIDPRVKVVGLFALIVAAALASRLWTLAAILTAATILAVLSRLSTAHAGIAGVGERLRVQRRYLDSRAVSHARRGNGEFPERVGDHSDGFSARRGISSCQGAR